MPGKFGGKKKGRNKSSSSQPTGSKRAPYKGEEQIYAFAQKMLGGRFLIAKDILGMEHKCFIPGLFKGKKHWITPGTLILLQKRSFEDKMDVVYVYTNSEVHYLEKHGEIKGIQINEVEQNDTEDQEDNIIFEDI